MSLVFTKMHGCGNDFLILDHINEPDRARIGPEEAAFLCDRNFGLGADGLVILERGDQHVAKWKFFNCDGSVAEMCGNAARCVIRYLADFHVGHQEEVISVETAIGVIRGKVLQQNNEVSGVEVTLFPDAKTRFEYEEHIVKTADDLLTIYSVNTGVPHAVLEVKDLDTYPVQAIGSQLVKHPMFQPEGTNVTFFQKFVGHQIRSTTFERGVEKQTFACGTGALAAAVVYSQLYLQALPIQVAVPGGQLEVDQSPVAKLMLLRGPAVYVSKIEIQSIPADFVPPKLFGFGEKKS